MARLTAGLGHNPTNLDIAESDYLGGQEFISDHNQRPI
jgi:hypothetical protein